MNVSLNLYIRSDDGTSVIVADRKTGYAIATFFYQRDKNNNPTFDAVVWANEFIYAVRTIENKQDKS